MTTFSASALVGRHVRRLRQVRDWTAKELAERCAQAGAAHLTMPVIVNLETGRKGRQFTVDEWLTLGWVLTTPPLLLLTPAAGEILQVVPGVEIDAAKALEWIQGEPCENCRGKPTEGFTCNTCGRSGS